MMFRSITPAQTESDRKKWQRIQALADNVINECEKSAKEFSEISVNTRFFLEQLAAYLKKRKTELRGSDDDEQIQTRSYFIQGIVNQIKDGKRPDLSEKKIEKFNGTFSHNLYDICKQYDSERDKKMELVELKTTPLSNR